MPAPLTLPPPELSLGEQLRALIDQLPQEGVSLGTLLDVFGDEGLLLLTALMVLVFLVPVSIPGVSTVFGAAILMNLWLVSRGPSMLDRVLALDTMAVNVIALITLWGIRTASAINFEAALLFAMTGFVGTVAYAKFVLRGDVIE